MPDAKILNYLDDYDVVIVANAIFDNYVKNNYEETILLPLKKMLLPCQIEKFYQIYLDSIKEV